MIDAKRIFFGKVPFNYEIHLKVHFKMDKYIAVMMSKDKIQLCIPQKWYGAFDCNGYNHGINRNVKRRIFYSPFGDNIDADFTAPVYEEYMADRNACYEVFFLKMFDTKVGCLSFLEKRRILYPAVYNSRRLDEMVPNGVAEAGGGANEPEQVIGNEENLHATSMQQQLELIDEPFVNEDVFVDRVVNERIERDVEQIVEQRLEEVAEQFVERNVVQGAMQNIGSEIVVPEMEMVEHSIVELNTHIADDSQAPMSTDNQNIASGNDISATSIKVEIKTENFERFLLANASCPVIDLTHDPEEEANLAAIASHNELDDSDDEMEFLDCGPEQFVPQTLKYDFGGHDLLSGNMPFVTDVSTSRICCPNAITFN